jgi:hypothetical protein
MLQEQDSKNNAWTDIVPRLRSKWQKAPPSVIFHRYLLNPKPLAQFPPPQKEGILETTELLFLDFCCPTCLCKQK